MNYRHLLFTLFSIITFFGHKSDAKVFSLVCIDSSFVEYAASSKKIQIDIVDGPISFLNNIFVFKDFNSYKFSIIQEDKDATGDTVIENGRSKVAIDRFSTSALQAKENEEKRKLSLIPNSEPFAIFSNFESDFFEKIETGQMLSIQKSLLAEGTRGIVVLQFVTNIEESFLSKGQKIVDTYVYNCELAE